MRCTPRRSWSWLFAAAWLLVSVPWCAGQSIARVPGLADPEAHWNFGSELWAEAEVVGGFKVPGCEADEPTPAAQPTEVRLAHDGQNLYVRYTAFDDAIDRARAKPLDEFADDFPQGDHGEMWVSHHGSLVFAFDCNGNKYDAHNYDSFFYSGFRVESRQMEDRWEAILVIPLDKLVSGEVGNQLQLSFVRHLDHGANVPERSTATGKSETERSTFTLE